MKLKRFEVTGLAHYSYAIQSSNNMVVIDPKRDIDTYLHYASEHRLTITHVLETHIHADFASGANALAQATEAELWLSAHDQGERFQYAFPHQRFRDGQQLRIGDVRIAAIHTPGHTPEHLSFVLHDESRGAYPMALMSGDFVFVGSFGRPDLLGDDAKRELAARLFESIHHKISELPDGVEVHPAHGAGSMCGSGMSQREQSTLGYERACNRWFAEGNLQCFVDHMLTNVPPFPDYYRRMKSVNAEGPLILEAIPGNVAIPLSDFRGRWEGGATVIDLRSPDAFGAGHIPGAFNIGAGPLLSVWAAWVVPYDTPILLVGDDSIDYDEACRSLVRVGLDDIQGYLKDGMQAWTASGGQQSRVPQVPVSEMVDLVNRGAYLLDVRADGEWNEQHVPGASHIFAGHLPARVTEVPSDRPVYTICGGGYRSSLSASVLLRAGVSNVANVAGGMAAWKERGLPVASEQPDSRVNLAQTA